MKSANAMKPVDRIVNRIRECYRIPQTLSGFRFSFFSELANGQRKARAGILNYSKEEIESKVLSIVSGIHEQISKHCLNKSVDATFLVFGNTKLELMG